MTDGPVVTQDALDRLTYEVALLYFRMRLAATEYVGQGEHSSGRRSVLKSLAREGPQAVPQMARVRSVSRQHIQTVVDGLRADGFVRRRPNPAHKRSKLIALTARGDEFVAAMHDAEAVLFAYLGQTLRGPAVRTATEVVRELRGRLEDPAWERLARAALTDSGAKRPTD